MRDFLKACKHQSGVRWIARLAWIHFRHWCIRPAILRANRAFPCQEWDSNVVRGLGLGGLRFRHDLKELDLLMARARPTIVPHPLLDTEAALDKACKDRS